MTLFMAVNCPFDNTCTPRIKQKGKLLDDTCSSLFLFFISFETIFVQPYFKPLEFIKTEIPYNVLLCCLQKDSITSKYEETKQLI